MHDPDDVPSPIDLRDLATATTWAAEADVKRPWRADIRATIAARLRELARARVVDAAQLGILDAARLRILELGSGPGLLAEAILREVEAESYTLFDFSPPFLDMCRARLADRANVRYVLGDFKQPDWMCAVEPPFDAVVTMQAVHELRHTKHAQPLYAQVRPMLRAGGLLVVCDHEPMDNRPLSTSSPAQHAAMRGAGFHDVQTLLVIDKLYVVTGVA